MVQTAREALDECVKIDPTRVWITTEKQQYKVHTDPPQTSFITLYSAWCSSPDGDGERFESYSWDEVIAKARAACAAKEQNSNAASDAR